MVGQEPGMVQGQEPVIIQEQHQDVQDITPELLHQRALAAEQIYVSSGGFAKSFKHFVFNLEFGYFVFFCYLCFKMQSDTVRAHMGEQRIMNMLFIFPKLLSDLILPAKQPVYMKYIFH